MYNNARLRGFWFQYHKRKQKVFDSQKFIQLNYKLDCVTERVGEVIERGPVRVKILRCRCACEVLAVLAERDCVTYGYFLDGIIWMM